MKKLFTRAGLWGLWGLCIFVGAIHIHFPDEEIVEGLRSTQPLRFFVPASAGTGKSFLLETIYIFSQKT